MSLDQSSSAVFAVSSAVSDPRFWSHGKRVGKCLLYVGSRDRDGYGRVLRVAISRSPFQAHRYAWLLTHGELPAGKVVMHTCDNPPCVEPTHLVLGTQGDNIADRDAKGRHHPGRMLGEAHPSHKLTDELVLEIRHLYAEGFASRAIAFEYGVSYGTVWQIVNRRTWTHLPIDGIAV